MRNELEGYLEGKKRIVDKALESFFPKDKFPPAIHRAMRYSMFPGGKRIRPILVLMSARACNHKILSRDVLPCACAVEMVHTYSLIHDDLPAMDDASKRRGRATVHKRFNEAIAVLTGDALLTLAFETISSMEKKNLIPQILYELARASGCDGMIGGQVLDIEMEKGRWRLKGKNAGALLEYIHRNKTAAIIKASLKIGAMIAGGSKKEIDAIERYGERIGVAFQIVDDMLDVTGDEKKLGKEKGDLKRKKLTYPALYGLERAGEDAARLVGEAKKYLSPFGERAKMLRGLADYIVRRER